MNKSGIYIITNLINNKCYIGSSVDIDRRFKEHILKLKTNKHNNKHLQASANKYGLNVFVFDILCNCLKEDLLYYEQKCMDFLKPEYNICKLAHSPSLGKGHKMSLETRAKMSLSKIGNTNHTGKVVSSEARANMSLALIGNTNTLGFKHTEETKAKMSMSGKGKKRSEEAIKKGSESLKGHIVSEETRAKISATLKLRAESKKAS